MRTEADGDGLLVLVFDSLDPPFQRVEIGRKIRECLNQLSESQNGGARESFGAGVPGVSEIKQ